MERCSILFVCRNATQVRHTAALRASGFVVNEVEDLPGLADLVNHHVVVICPPESDALPRLAARLRAAPHFGRHLLIALVATKDHERVRRDGIMSGFDEVLPESISGRQLAATIIQRLRSIPELECLLGPFTRRRSAA